MFKLPTPRLAVATLFVFNGALFGAWASRIPAVQQRFDLTHSDLGVYLLLMAIGAMVSFPFSGRLADKLGATKVTIFCATFYSIGLLFIALSPNRYVLGLALFYFGMTHGGMDVAMNGWAAKVEKDLGKSIMSNFHALFSVGAGLGAAFGVLATSLDMTYQTHFIIFSLVLMPIIYISYQVKFNYIAPIEQNAFEKPNKKFSLPKGPLLLLGLIAFSNAVGEGAMADWSAIYLSQILNASDSQAAIGFTIFSIAMVAMRFVGDGLITRYGSQNIVRFSGAMSIIGGLTIAITSNLYFAYLGFGLMGIGYAIVMPLVFTNAAKTASGKSGAAIANIAIFAYGGLLLGPPLIGFIAQISSLRFAFLLFIILATIVFFGAKIFGNKPNTKLQ